MVVCKNTIINTAMWLTAILRGLVLNHRSIKVLINNRNSKLSI